jgi:hypothetical protein
MYINEDKEIIPRFRPKVKMSRTWTCGQKAVGSILVWCQMEGLEGAYLNPKGLLDGEELVDGEGVVGARVRRC